MEKTLKELEGMPKDNLPMLLPEPEDGQEKGIEIDHDKRQAFNTYLDDILPPDPRAPHPFHRFVYSEIVRHPVMGTGIITGYRIADYAREMEGLGVQFVRDGVMVDHRVFTPAESMELLGTQVVFDIKRHASMTLEQVLDQECK